MLSRMRHTKSSFWVKLRKLYLEMDEGETEWNNEEQSLKNIIRKIRQNIKDRYRFLAPLGVGGAGVVIKVEDINMRFERALKFPRPARGKEDLMERIMVDEIHNLSETVHPNIIEIYDKREIDVDDNGHNRKIDFYIMEFIKKAQDANKYFEKGVIKEEVLVLIIKQIIEGINHLHRLNYVHIDIKLENILISDDGRAIISDLGSARKMEPKDDAIMVVFSKDWAHPGLAALGTERTNDPNRRRGPAKRSDLKKSFDLYALGKNIIRLLKRYDQEGSLKLNTYTLKYLTLMGCRLLDCKNRHEECPFGLPLAAFNEIKYDNISEVLIDIKKLTGEYPIYKLIPELDEHWIQTIQSSSLSPTTITNKLRDIISHPFLARLNNISQLGIIGLVYPTASHSRFEHIMGVYTNVCRYINALYNDPINPLFKQIMNEVDLKSLLLAALFHDLGHYPMAHDLEEADETLFTHNKFTDGLLLGYISIRDGKSLNKLIARWGTTPNRILNIINADPSNVSYLIKDRILHTIIDGPIDADKLDYLVRDSINLNVHFGNAIDFERLLRCLTIVFSGEHNNVHAALGIHEKGKISAETVAFVRYAMFGQVYWHHTSRSAKSMLHRVIWESLRNLLIEKERNNFKNAEDFYKIEYDNTKLQTFNRDFADFIAKLQLPRARRSKEFSNFSQVLFNDRKLLAWFAERSNTSGMEIVKLIMNRNLYKRILVISKRESGALLDRIKKVRNDFNWRKIVELQDKIQEEIILRIRSHDNISKDILDNLLGLYAKCRILILIDIPKRRPGSEITLEYLPETDRYDIVQEWKKPSKLQDSVIWRELHGNFIESVGKVRVFCHPEIRDAIKIAIPQRELSRIVEESMKKLWP